MTAPICDMLHEYSRAARLRLHMPAHGGKRRGDRLPINDAAFSFDVTELTATDDLYHPTGAAALAERLAAEQFGSGAALFSCGGATLALQAAIAAASDLCENKAFLCDRRCHKSVANAFALIGIEPVWTVGVPDEETLSRAGAYIFTSYDYYGRAADLAKIREVCRRHGVVTVADNSHGAHLMFVGGGKKHPVSFGVDFTVDSLHKTLPVLTGGAVLHISKQMISRFGEGFADCVREKMSVFGSTSPSFLILASIDAALADIRNNMTAEGEKTYLGAVRAANGLRERFPSLFAPSDDPLRLYLCCEKAEDVYHSLSSRGISCEFCDGDGIIMILPYGFCDTDAELLAQAVREISPRPRPPRRPDVHIPEKAMSIRTAVLAEHERVSLKDAEGRISGAMYAVYPPGIPAVTAGERFDSAVIGALTGSCDTVSVVAEGNIDGSF